MNAKSLVFDIIPISILEIMWYSEVSDKSHPIKHKCKPIMPRKLNWHSVKLS